MVSLCVSLLAPSVEIMVLIRLYLRPYNVESSCFEGKDTYKPAVDKTYSVTRKDSTQPVQPPSTAGVLVNPSLDSLETVEGNFDQQRL